MTDDTTNWVTIKVPEADRAQAREYAPDDATYADCLVAGAERLNDDLDSDTARFADGNADITATVRPTIDEDALDDLTDEVEERMADAVADGATPNANLDAEAVADLLTERIDYPERQDVARIEGRIDDLETEMRTMLEGLQR